METSDIQPLVEFYHSRLTQVSLKFKRYLYGQINWDARVIGIRGERGVGKTTMLLQRIKEKYRNPDEVIYISLDHYWFRIHTLGELVGFLYKSGISEFYIDEVHKYEGWSGILKNLYDQYPGLRIIYTGSSMLKMGESTADMARRQTLYLLRGMSFREFLDYEGILRQSPLKLEEILKRHSEIAIDIVPKTKILKEFGNYLKYGYYPFHTDAGTDFLPRLQSVVNLVIESDLPAVEKVSYPTVEKCKKLLMIIAENVPLQPNMEKLATSMSTTRNTLLNLLYHLDEAEILELLTVELKNYKRLVNPEKIYLGNTNLMWAFSPSGNVGTMRETFFANQLSTGHTVQMPPKGDFLVDGKWLFEVGGPDKDFSQIASIPESYLAVDGAETGYGNRIPLWIFGMMY